MKKDLILLKDIVIPKGTILENIDGTKREYSNGNYEITIGLTDDSTAEFVIGFDELDEKLTDIITVRM